MTPSPESINSITRAIQLALGPVFLLTGIAGLLNVMTGRLSRIIDRGRALTGNQYDVITMISSGEGSENLKLQLKKLERRRRFTSIGITSCTIAALLVCMVVITIFLEMMLGTAMEWLIAAQFSLAMLALITGLAFFLREVHVAAQTIRISVSEH